jgi:hypothetical protein
MSNYANVSIPLGCRPNLHKPIFHFSSFFPTIQSIQTHFNFLQIFFYNFSILLKGFDTEEPAILSKYFIGMCVCTNNETFALVVRK